MGLVVPQYHVVIEEDLQKPGAQVLQYVVDEDRLHFILLQDHVHALLRLLIKYRDQHVFEISVAVLAKAEGDLLVGISVKRAAADIHLQPMSKDLPNSVFILHVFGLYNVHYLQADVPSSHFLRQLRLRLPYELQRREVLLLMNFLKYLLCFFFSIFGHHLFQHYLYLTNSALFDNQ